MKKPGSVVLVPGNLNSFFRNWFEFLAPFHKLTAREMDVAAAFVRHRYELSKSISDPEILDREVMSDYTKKQIREECNITLAYFQVIMGKLRKNNIIIDGKLNPRFIPDLKDGEKSFSVLLYFKFE